MTDRATIPPPQPYLHLLERVSFEPTSWPEPGSVSVTPVWKGVDRPEGTGVSLRPADIELAERLRALILRGDAYGRVEVRTDTDGRTYMSAQHRFAVMELAEDLDALGA